MTGVALSSTPADYRGAQTPAEFLAMTGNVWIGLIETIACKTDKESALATYFGLSDHLIREWIDARGRIRCVAVVSATNHRCSKLIGHRVEYDPRVWATAAGRCPSHAPG